MTLTIYKAYKTFNYDRIQDRWAQINIYTLATNRVDMNRELVDYYDSHLEESILATFGEDKRIIKINRDQRLGSVGDSHIIVPISLSTKKYHRIPADEIALLEEETKEAGDVWAGSINNGGVAPGGEIRAILQNAGEVHLLHPVIEDSQKTYAATKENDENDPNSYTEYFKFPEKNGGTCNYWNCPIHFGDFRKLRYENQWLLLGESLNHPRVLKMGKLRKMKKLVEYSNIMSMSLQVTDSMDAMDDDSPNLEDYYNELQ